MFAWGVESRGARAFGAGLLLCAASGMAGCARPSVSYAGIPLASGAADPELRNLARRAQAGDKHAQPELGTRYEEGRGVGRNPDLAEKLHARAAAASGGSILIHSPRVRQAPPRLISTKSWPRIAGLVEARQRLESLQRKRTGR